MSDTEQPLAQEAAPAVAAPKSRKKPAKNADKSATAMAEADKRPAKLTGRVGRITVGPPSGGAHVEIEIATKAGDARCVSLDPSEGLRFSALLAMVGLALTSGSKLHLQIADGADGKLLIEQAEIRGKR